MPPDKDDKEPGSRGNEHVKREEKLEAVVSTGGSRRDGARKAKEFGWSGGNRGRASMWADHGSRPAKPGRSQQAENGRGRPPGLGGGPETALATDGFGAPLRTLEATTRRPPLRPEAVRCGTPYTGGPAGSAARQGVTRGGPASGGVGGLRRCVTPGGWRGLGYGPLADRGLVARLDEANPPGPFRADGFSLA